MALVEDRAQGRWALLSVVSVQLVLQRHMSLTSTYQPLPVPTLTGSGVLTAVRGMKRVRVQFRLSKNDDILLFCVDVKLGLSY
jgi:hypothetical protein